MKIEIWSDVVCPFCYIGKRHMEQALEQLPEIDAEIIWRSFELDTEAPEHTDANINEVLAKKYGKDLDWAKQMNANMVKNAEDVGLDYNMDDIQPANSFKAHQLLHLAKENGLQDEMKEALLAAYFTEGKLISDSDTLVKIAEGVGLDAREAASVLEEETYKSAVRQDEHVARQIGIQGVPFFYINEKYGLSGAQPVKVFKDAFQQIESGNVATEQ
ncbi:DsbA family oxidoreductase [Gracilimonas mengyeensis]|uniref:Protein disulfide-isomerase n=1 Tax=Gracilimonas mengyeensis TaxID=1302730 RepID=A0A521CI20_9BACT|nr:DsbA family oxidoreductase [Gracilimonas mengyeensis]SMO58350.1 protein disulfide-isomerase [Gracilimonas mengyeensis]